MRFLSGLAHQPFVIAEIGVNHNGSPDLARRLIDAAVEAGAHAVKFQSFRATELATATAAKARYQTESEPGAENQLSMLKRLELAPEDFRRLAAYCGKRAVFLSTAFDVAYLDFLVNELSMPAIKIGSGEITNGPLLLHAARTGKPILLSTGMCTLRDIEEALALIAFGYLEPQAQPDYSTLESYASSFAARQVLEERVALLHCVTEYPCPPEEANLLAMKTLARTFGLAIGYSDHTTGWTVAVAAAALGARIIEKHFTLDRTLPGPDHAASLEPREFAEMALAIRTTHKALGDGRKQPTPSEQPNRAVARRSLVAGRPIGKGEKYSADNLAAKRPGTDIAPMKFWEYAGHSARRDYAADEPIDP